MRTFSVVQLALVCAAAASGGIPAMAGPAPKAAPEKKESGWVFSLLPKSFQKNPHLELTVITEMTAEGRGMPVVSPAAPVYYTTFSAGFRQQGHAPGREKSLSQDQVESLLERSLATNGFRRAAPPNPPTQLIIFMWGSHNRLHEGDDENPSLSSQTIVRNVLDRAALVGGEKFASRLLDLFEQADSYQLASQAPVPPGGAQVITPELMDFANPVAMFRRASVKNEFLLEQAASDVYFVVASAYDYASMAGNQRRLLWRTRMTVAAQGVSQEQSLPTLVLSAAPYFGREMQEAETLIKRSMREGTVEVGTPRVVEPDVPDPSSREQKK